MQRTLDGFLYLRAGIFTCLVTVFCAIPAIILFWKLQEKKIQSKNVTQTEVILCLGHIEFKEA